MLFISAQLVDSHSATGSHILAGTRNIAGNCLLGGFRLSLNLYLSGLINLCLSLLVLGLLVLVNNSLGAVGTVVASKGTLDSSTRNIRGTGNRYAYTGTYSINAAFIVGIYVYGYAVSRLQGIHGAAQDLGGGDIVNIVLSPAQSRSQIALATAALSCRGNSQGLVVCLDIGQLRCNGGFLNNSLGIVVETLNSQ